LMPLAWQIRRVRWPSSFVGENATAPGLRPRQKRLAWCAGQEASMMAGAVVVSNAMGRVAIAPAQALWLGIDVPTRILAGVYRHRGCAYDRKPARLRRRCRIKRADHVVAGPTDARSASAASSATATACQSCTGLVRPATKVLRNSDAPPIRKILVCEG